MTQMGVSVQKIRVAVTVIFLVFIGSMSLGNRELLKNPVNNFIHVKAGFKKTTKVIASNLVSNQLRFKNSFINLNGFFARVCGKRKCNDVLLLKDNILTFDDDKTDWEKEWKTELAVKKTIELAEFSKQLNIPFVYVVTPYKISTCQDNLPQGIYNPINKITDKFLKELSVAGVSSLDLRPHFSATSEHIRKYFYRTDHHWSPDAAFLAYQDIMSEIERIDFKKRRIKSYYSSIDSWKRYEKKEWTLGSHGKRVGIYFAGVDPLIYYIPRFATKMSAIMPYERIMYKGDYAAANIREKYIQNSDYFNYHPGSVCIGDNYPLVHHYNFDAPNKEKILILRDSFGLPLEAFMSTEFSEIDTLDSRFYKASTIAEYILWNRPDLVLLIRYTRSTGDPVFRFDNYINNSINSYRDKKVLLKEYNASLAASKSNYNHAIIPVLLQAGKTYSVSLKDIRITQGKTDGVSAVLYDFKKNRIVNQDIFDVEFCNKSHEDVKWTFKVPEVKSEYALLVYAGIPGKTKNISVDYSGINVSLLN